MKHSYTCPLVLVVLLSSIVLSFSKDRDLNYEFVKAATKGQIEEVRALLQKGADLNAQVEHGYSALMLASGNGQEETVKLLLAKGAKVNMQATMKETALHLAAGRGRTRIVEMLVEARADFRVTDTGLTPLMMAVAGGHSKGDGYLLSKKEDVNAKQPDGWTVLMHAAVTGDMDTIKLLGQRR